VRARLWTFGLLLAGLAAMFAVAMNARYNHDEGQFIAAGQLIATRGLLPYRDFPSFHMPYLAGLYAILFRLSDHLLLAARAFSTLSAWLTLLLVMRLAWTAFAGRGETQRLLLAGGAGALLLFNPVFSYAFPLAWNAALPALLTVAAIASHCRGAREGAPGWFVLSGLFIACAIGARLTYAPLGLPFLIMAWWLPGAAPVRRALCALAFCAGLALGLAPAAFVALLAPDQFLFDNLIYNSRINAVFRATRQGLDSPLRDKAVFLLRTLVHPGSLALFAGFVWFALLPKAPWKNYPRLLVLAVFPFALAGALVPTPSYTQYYYLPVVLCVLGIVFSLAAEPLSAPARRTAACILLLVICSGAWAYRHLFLPGAPRQWIPMILHSTGMAVRSHLPAGRVLTLAPIVPLEAGLDIYPAFATGSFAWRTASLLTADERARHGFISEADLPALLAAQPPDGILVNYDKKLEAPFLSFAESNGCRRLKLPGKKILWIRPAP
jgi:hypothetical protein